MFENNLFFYCCRTWICQESDDSILVGIKIQNNRSVTVGICIDCAQDVEGDNTGSAVDGAVRRNGYL